MSDAPITGFGEILIDGTTHAEDGTKLEPEEKIAERVQAMPVEVALGNQVLQREPTQLPASAGFSALAGDMAKDLQQCCALCKFFDKRLMAQQINAELTTPEGVERLRKQKKLLLQLNHPDAALYELGVCHAATDRYGAARDDYVTVHPLGKCPTDLNCWRPKSYDTAKAGAAIYDGILTTAK